MYFRVLISGMLKKILLLFTIFSLVFISCSSKKNILYLQDVNVETDYKADYETYTIKTDDILKVDILAKNKDISLEFNPQLALNQGISKDVLLFQGYQVDSNGNISLPEIGKIKAVGYTLTEFRNFIYDYLVSNNILIDPIVDIKILNSHFTIIGEVNNPGRYDFLENNLNIFEALGMAGDLTINGVRDDIKIIREIDGNKKVRKLDLTKVGLLNDPYFQIKSGDIIVINPNNSRVKNAGIIGNSGTLLTLLSFILSSVIVISN